jgi:hypothetical protein
MLRYVHVAIAAAALAGGTVTAIAADVPGATPGSVTRTTGGPMALAEIPPLMCPPPDGFCPTGYVSYLGACVCQDNGSPNPYPG